MQDLRMRHVASVGSLADEARDSSLATGKVQSAVRLLSPAS